MTDELKERVKSLGQALTDFAKVGPLPTCSREDMLQLVDAFVEKYATPADAAVNAYRLHCEGMHQIIVEARGLPVHSVVTVSDTPGEKAARLSILPGMNAFEALRPRLQQLLGECVDDFRREAPAYYERERAGLRELVQQFLAFVPDGGTKLPVGRTHVMPIKRDVAALVEWDKQAIVIHWSTYFDQARSMFEITPDVLAVEWQTSPSCLVAEHLAKQGASYVVRGSWAWEKGLVKASANGSFDSMNEWPGRAFGCTCRLGRVHNLKSLLREQLTPAGIEAMERGAEMREALFGNEPLVKLKTCGLDDRPAQPVKCAGSSERPGFVARLFSRRS